MLPPDYPTNPAERFLNARQRRVRADRATRRHQNDPLFLARAMQEQHEALIRENQARATLRDSDDLWGTDWRIERVKEGK